MSLPASEPTHPVPRRIEPAKVTAKWLHLPLPTLYERARNGTIPGAIRVGRRLLFAVAKLEHWLDAGGDAGRTNS